jgi:Family of unknown function (DUF6238)
VSTDSSPYLRAATAGLRHHARTAGLDTSGPATGNPADRRHLDALHTHLVALHQVLDALTDTTYPPHPAAGRHLATARTRIWQATAAVHDAFHALPSTGDHTSAAPECRPDDLPEGPPFLTICQRHLATTHQVRRKTTPNDLTDPLHGHTTHCSR